MEKGKGLNNIVHSYIGMDVEKLYKRLKGPNSLVTVMDELKVSRNTAMQYISILRKAGYVRTEYTSEKKRVYYISYRNKMGGVSYYEIINKYAPLGLRIPKIHLIYGREVSLEETLIFAVKTKEIRVFIASLALFKKINNWSLLYKLAKKEGVLREVGAFYDVASTVVRTRKMSKKFRNLALPKKYSRYIEIIPRIKSKSFKRIEARWKVYIPLSKGDLEEYVYDKYRRSRKVV